MKKGESNYKVWLGKASNDMLNIDNNLASEDVRWDTVCFHAQQAARPAGEVANEEYQLK